MMYYYDADNRLIGFIVNGSTYYYVYNTQGDIIKILDGNMEEVVEYKYDTWGNVIGMEGSDYGKWVGSLNPFRYRGYYYDDETSLYYLYSRYYNPECGRFLNADGTIIGNIGSSVHNILAYASNNPVMNYDSGGYIVCTILGGLIGGIANGIKFATEGYNFFDGFGTGCLGGMIAGLGVDAAIASGGIAGILFVPTLGAIGSGVQTALEQNIKGQKLDWGEISTSATIGAVSNTVSFGASALFNVADNGKVFRSAYEILHPKANDWISGLASSIMVTTPTYAISTAVGIAAELRAKNSRDLTVKMDQASGRLKKRNQNTFYGPPISIPDLSQKRQTAGGIWYM